MDHMKYTLVWGVHWGSNDNGTRIPNIVIKHSESQHQEFHQIGNFWSWPTNAIGPLDQDFLEY